MAELKKLDIGYGYTADGGVNYPFRGKGTGMMPSMTEVLKQFPDKSLLINVKSSDPAGGELLAHIYHYEATEFTVEGHDEELFASLSVCWLDRLYACCMRAYSAPYSG